jgi:hypothetical protein
LVEDLEGARMRQMIIVMVGFVLVKFQPL